MKFLPRTIGDDEVDQAITQRDQFNSDEFKIAETLVREPEQNTLDGRSKLGDGSVRTRIKLVEPTKANSSYWASILSQLAPHLLASGMDNHGVDFAMPRILLIEDFGTTGLLGAIDKKDKLNFSDFYRRFGVSHKGGGSGGRWGLGKLVFSSASAIGTFFGLTIRDDDPQRARLLMGQSILNNHAIDDINYAPHIFFGDRAADNGIQIPVTDPAAVAEFCKAAGISRNSEPGLSIAIMCPRDGLEPDDLLPHLIRNYFFPILTSDLTVEIGDQVVNAASFDELAKAHGGPELADGQLIQFIRAVDADRHNAPKVSLPLEWSKVGGNISIADTELAALRRAYSEGKLIGVRAPIELKRVNGLIETTHVDAFLQKAPDSVNGQALYVRGGITIPGESRTFRGKKAFAALLASDSAATEFLGDAENPAHTRWIGTADKLTKKWAAPDKKIAAVRRLLNGLSDLLSEADKQVDESALLDFFSIPIAAKEVKKLNATVKPAPPKLSVPPPPPTPRSFRVAQIAGGFEIRGNPGAAKPLPYQLNVRVAYGVRRGDPFKKFKKHDFDFTARDLNVAVKNASWQSTEPNMIQVDVSSHDFLVKIVGFDHERDIELDVKAKL